jgi:hypothetical protein
MAKKKSAFNVDEAKNTSVYHGSHFHSPDEFLKAPLLHVGTQDQANQIIERPESYIETDDGVDPTWPTGISFNGVHKLQFSQFSEFHPKVMSDSAVNVAHGLLLRKNKMHSREAAIPSNFEELEKHPDVQEALKAFESNKIVPYRNDWETPVTPKGNPLAPGEAPDSAFISYAVPSPRLNLRVHGAPDPQTQPVLPMDYSGASDSKTTKRHKEEFAKRESE